MKYRTIMILPYLSIDAFDSGMIFISRCYFTIAVKQSRFPLKSISLLNSSCSKPISMNYSPASLPNPVKNSELHSDKVGS